MSAIADTVVHHPAESRGTRFSALRDLLLAVSLTTLAALAMEASGAPVPNAPDGAPPVIEWHGNSGTPPTVR